MADVEVKDTMEAEEPKTESSESKNAEASSKSTEVETSPKEDETKLNGHTDTSLSALEKKIIRQIEYYFGDINLPKDRFLQEQVKLDEGWIPMSTMLKFKRLSSLSMDEKFIMTALTKSQDKLMEVNEEAQKIRRDPARPLPEWNDERKAELNDRTVYVKGFPTEGLSLDFFLEFFNKFGKIDNVFMNMFHDKLEKKHTFKGSVFVMFHEKEEAEKFLKLESVKYEDTELSKKWQREYSRDKKEKVKEGKEAMRNKYPGSRPQTKEEKDEEKKETTKERVPAFSKLGTILHMTGFASDTTREDITEKLEPFNMEVAYIDYLKGNEEAWIRLSEENTVKTLKEKIDEAGTLTICGSEIESRALEGEEETTYLEKAKEDKEKRWLKNQSKFRNKGSYRGGRGRGRGRKRGNEEGESRPKRQKRD